MLFVNVTVTSDNAKSKLKIANLLIQNGAVTQKSKGQKESVIDVAVKSIIKEKDSEKRLIMVELLTFLLKNGGDPNDCREGKDSLLILTLRNRALDVAECLLRAGANVNHRGKMKRTALMEWLDACTGNLVFIYPFSLSPTC